MLCHASAPCLATSLSTVILLVSSWRPCLELSSLSTVIILVNTCHSPLLDPVSQGTPPSQRPPRPSQFSLDLDLEINLDDVLGDIDYCKDGGWRLETGAD